MNEPVVSYLMTVFNGELFLQAAIDSVLNQSVQNVELVIIDDGSSDGTSDLIESYDDPRIKFRRLNRVGRSQALNAGVSICSGEFLAILDADDLALPTRSEEQIKYLDDNPGVSVVGSGYLVENVLSGASFESTSSLADGGLKRRLLDGNPFGHSTVMMRLSAVKSIGGYNEKLTNCVDLDIFCRISPTGSFGMIAKPLTVRRVHGDNYFIKEISPIEYQFTALKIRLRYWRSSNYSWRHVLAPFRPVIRAFVSGALSKLSFWRRASVVER